MEDTSARRGRPRDIALVERRKTQILAAAATIFARAGYPNTDVREIADACDVSKGTIYTYFASKEALFLATVDRAMDQLREAVRGAYAGIADPLDRLTIAIRAYLTFFRDHPEHAELLIIERAEYRDRKMPTYFEHRRTNSKEWEQLYADLIREGRIRDVPVERILSIVGDLVYGTMFTNHFTGQHKSPDDQAHDVIDILFHGILTPDERARRETH